MKAVLISIQPKWVEKIVSGQKTIEVRKSRPKLETPFKCYIYCTQGKCKDLFSYGDWIYKNRGKVIGEFLCDWTTDYNKDIGVNAYLISDDDFEKTCLTLFDELWEYGKGKTLYGWHISNLKIYDNPKELSEFNNLKGEPIKRAYQSWGYVEVEE